MPPAPVASGATPTSQIGSLLAGGAPGGGVDEVRAQLEGYAQQLNQLKQQIAAVAEGMPFAAQEFSQMNQLLMAALSKAGRAVSDQTASAQAVPTGSSMGAGPM
jgi:hypothetical protein